MERVAQIGGIDHFEVLAKLKGKNPLQLARLAAGQDAIDSWLASPEGQAALNTLREESL